MIIAGIRVDVRERAPTNDWDLEGEFDACTTTIFINRDLSPERKRLVLAHEVLHALLDLTGARDFLELSNKKEEKLVEIMATGMASILKGDSDAL